MMIVVMVNPLGQLSLNAEGGNGTKEQVREVLTKAIEAMDAEQSPPQPPASVPPRIYLPNGGLTRNLRPDGRPV
jgi:hypothetical protein